LDYLDDIKNKKLEKAENLRRDFEVEKTVSAIKASADKVAKAVETEAQQTRKVEVVNPQEVKVEHTIDFQPLLAPVDELSKKLDVLVAEATKEEPPEVKETEDVFVVNQLDYTQNIQEVLQAINKLELNPKIEINTPEVDFTPIQETLQAFAKKIDDSVKKINKIEIPKTELDVTEVINGLSDVQNAIKNLRFPVSNYILPFKDTNGRATQVQLDGSGNLPISASISGADGAITDGVDSNIKATVKDLTNANPLTVAIVDTSGDQVSSFGGGTQYTEGDVDTSITGTAVMWEDTSDTMRAVSASKPLPVNVWSSIPTVTDTLTALSDTVVLPLTGQSLVAIQISGTYSLTALLEATVDGTNWERIYAFQDANVSDYWRSSFTSTQVNDIWYVNVGGYSSVRLRCSSYTSGTASVTMRGSLADASQRVVFSQLIGSDVNIGVDANQAGNWSVRITDTVGDPIQSSTLADNTNTPTAISVGSFGMMYDGTFWDMVRGDATNGLLVNLGSNNDVTVSGTVTVSGDVGTLDQFDLTNSNPAAVAIVDGNGTQITSFGGGTQYTDGDADATPTGTVAMGFDGSNVQALSTDTGGNLNININESLSIISSVNSTTTPLTANSTFSGTYEDILAYQQVSVMVRVSHTGTLYLDYSSDGTNIDKTLTYAITDTTNGTLIESPASTRYFKLRYTNGGTNQTTFRLQTLYHPQASGFTFSRVDTALTDAIMTQNTRAVLAAKTPGGTYTNIDATTGGNLKVSLEEFDGAVLGQETMANSLPVAIASDQTAIPVTDNGGTLTVDGTVTANLSATDNAVLDDIALNQTDGTQRTAILDQSGNLLDLHKEDDNFAVGADYGIPIMGLRDGTPQQWEYIRVDTISGDANTIPARGIVSTEGFGMVYNGTTWDRARGDATNGMLVNLGSNNDVTVTGTVTANAGTGTFTVGDGGSSLTVDNGGTFVTQENGAALTALQLIDDTVATTGSAITTKGIAAVGTDGTNARVLKTDTSGELQVDVLTLPASTNTIEVVGDVAEDQALSGNPVRIGMRASAAEPSSMSGDGDIVTPWGDRKGRQVVTMKAATSSVTSVNDAATSQSLLASNTSRLGATIHNDSTSILYLKLGTTASTTSYTVKMLPDSYYEVPFGYTGAIDGIWSSDASGAARITEIS
jgi:hypothetical protein